MLLGLLTLDAEHFFDFSLMRMGTENVNVTSQTRFYNIFKIMP